MASTIAYYEGTGYTTDFAVPFDYLAKKFVKVSVGLTLLEGGDYGDKSKDYFFVDKNKVRLKVPPKVGETVTIRRFTSATERVVTFKDASILKAKDLDVASIQTTHIAEEGRDAINDSLTLDKEGNWDAKGDRVVNVGNPINDGDAVNYITYKTDAKGAHQARVEAEKARVEAEKARDRAVEAETNSKTSEVNAKASEVSARASAGVAVSVAESKEIVTIVNNMDNVITTSNSIKDVNIIGSDLTGALKDKIFDDYGDLGKPSEPEVTIVGGNIKNVSDNMGDIKKVSKELPSIKKAFTARDEAVASAKKAKESADSALSSSMLSEDYANESLSHANASKASADSVKNLEEQCKTSAGVSVNSAKLAVDASNYAKVSSDSAKQVASEVATHRDEAVESKESALNSKTVALDASNKASLSAVKADASAGVAVISARRAEDLVNAINKGT